MKKTPLFLLLILFAMSAFAQKAQEYIKPELPMDEDNKLVTYKEVVQVEGTAQDLYDRALAWVKTEYVNTNEVIKSSDRDAGLLELRSSVKIHSRDKTGKPFFKNIVYYRFKIECRDGRYRYVITDFNEKATAAAPIEVWFNSDGPKWEPIQFEYLKQIGAQINELISSLKKGMKPTVEKVDEW